MEAEPSLERLFAPADRYRSEEKDISVTALVREQLHELLTLLTPSSWFVHSRLAAWSQELDVLAMSVYALLTRTRGQSTLGEELTALTPHQLWLPDSLASHSPPNSDAEIAAASQSLPRLKPLSSNARYTHLFLSTWVPYLYFRARARILGAGESLTREERQLELHAQQQSESSRAAASASLRRRRGSRRASRPEASVEFTDASSNLTNSSMQSRLASIILILRRRVTRMLMSCVAWFDRALPMLDRVHLALFFISGRFLTWSDRWLSIVYVYPPASIYTPMQRPRYAILGTLLLWQLAAEGLLQLRDWFNASHLISQVGLASTIQMSNQSALRERAEAFDVIEDGDAEAEDAEDEFSEEHDDEQESDSSSAAPLSARQCLLHLGPLRAPTALLCGHVMCWSCLAECGKQKPECPLCRLPFRHEDMLRLSNYR